MSSPVGVEHLDISALLHEVAALRAEVRSMSLIRSDIAEIREALKKNECQTAENGNCETTYVKKAAGWNNQDENQVNVITSASAGANSSSHATQATSYASAALCKSPTTAPSISVAKKPIIGLSSNCKLKIVTDKRAVNLFVSPLDPDTPVTEVSAMLSTYYVKRT